MINWLFRDWLSLAMIVDDVPLKNQVTSYFLEKNITAITKVITDVWRKGWARSIVAFSLGQGDPLAGLAVLKRWTRYSGWRWCHMVPTCPQTNSTSTCTRRVTGYLSARASTSSKARGTTRLSPCALWFSCCKQWSLQAVAGRSRDWQRF